MGSSAAYALSLSGMRVLCLDQFGIPNTFGSSHGHSRITRLAYFEHPGYVPMIQRANVLWRELEAKTGDQLLRVTGGLYIGPPDCRLIKGSTDSAHLHHLEYELLDRAGIGERYPQFQVPENYTGFYEPAAGVLFPERCVSALVRASCQLGTEFHGHEKVIGWTSDGVAVRVQTERHMYRGRSLVICGGPWATEIANDARLQLKVTRQIAAWVWPKTPTEFTPGRFPICAIQDLEGNFTYAFPMFPERPGLKIASHDLGRVVNPDEIHPSPAISEVPQLLPVLSRFIPEAAGEILSLESCLYTNSPDGHFIVDKHPEMPNVVYACGFSGHGFKFATAIGEALCDLILERSPRTSIAFLSATRFT